MSNEIDTRVSKIIVEYGLPMNKWNVLSINCGLHSGLPECCIVFFMTVWMPSFQIGFLDMPYMKHIRSLKDRPQYIPCPACLVNKNIVMIKECDCPCHEE